MRWPTFHHYWRYSDVADFLRALQRAYPTRIRLVSIGKSRCRRDILLAELTDTSTGAYERKSGLWVDGVTHANETIGCVACLALIRHLLHAAEGKHLLRRRTFYILPAVDPDGMDEYLAPPSSSPADWVSLGPRPKGSFIQADLDGDGRLFCMRVPNPNGGWRTSRSDPRIMLRRDPRGSSRGGPFYDLYMEGYWDNRRPTFDPGQVFRYGKQWTNLNRNWPAGWDAQNAGGGLFPLSEMECRAVADAWKARPNLCGCVNFHASGRVHMRASAYRLTRDLPPEDVRLFRMLDRLVKASRKGDETHGGYKDHFGNTRAAPGNQVDFFYDCFGVPQYCLELWSASKEAGLAESFHPGLPSLSYRGEKREGEKTQLAVLRWQEEACHGRYHKEWTPFDHPQLGRIEIGGWAYMPFWFNAPEEFIEREAAAAIRFPLAFASLLPTLALTQLRRSRTRAGMCRVTGVVANAGTFPTYITAHGRDIRMAGPVWGAARSETTRIWTEVAIGHLKGGAKRRFAIEIPAGQKEPIVVQAVCQKAGQISARIR